MISVRNAPFAVYQHSDCSKPLEVSTVVHSVRAMANDDSILIPLIIDVPVNNGHHEFICSSLKELQHELRENNILLVGWKIDNSWVSSVRNYIKSFDMVVFSSLDDKKEKNETHSSWVSFSQIEFGGMNNDMVFKDRLRSGQIILGDDIIILNDVHSGSEVHSKGNIRVRGKCNGNISAGESNNRDAYIWCENFQASLISIAGIYQSQDEFPKNVHGRSVLITLDDNNNMLWDTRKRTTDSIKNGLSAMFDHPQNP